MVTGTVNRERSCEFLDSNAKTAGSEDQMKMNISLHFKYVIDFKLFFW